MTTITDTTVDRMEDKRLECFQIPIRQIKIGERIRKDMSGVLSIANSINDTNLIHPIVVKDIENDPKYKYELLDGHNRIEAFRLLDRKEIPAVINNEFQEPLVVELISNTVRKDFTHEELKNGIELAKGLLEKQKALGIRKKGKKIDLISRYSGVKPSTVEKYNRIYNMFSKRPELYADVRMKLEKGTITLENAFKAVNRTEMHERANIPELPYGTFDVVLCKPALRNNLHYTNKKGGGVSTTQLYNLEVNEHTAENAAIFVWCTGHRYDMVRKAMATWGFQYKNQWVLSGGGIGQGLYCIPEHEMLIIGTKGNMPRALKTFSSFIPGTRDFIQNDKIYEMIEEMYPNRSYLTMFSDVKRRGWENWNVMYIPRRGK